MQGRATDAAERCARNLRNMLGDGEAWSTVQVKDQLSAAEAGARRIASRFRR